MGKARRRPGIDRAKVLRRLRRALEEKAPVRIRRRYDADPIDGFVVGVGRRWVAVARLSDGMDPDGHDLVRIKDIRKVGIGNGSAVLGERVLKARDHWPLTGPVVRLDSLDEVLEGAGRGGALVAVHAERRSPDRFWVGRLAGRDEDGGVLLDGLDAAAEWEGDEPHTFRPKELTRLTVGDAYVAALALVAPARP